MPDRSSIPAGRRKRIDRLLATLNEKKLSGIFISQPENRRYLSGFRPSDPQLDESSGFLILGPDLALLGTDPRYEMEAFQQARGFQPFIYRGGLEGSWPELQKRLPPLKRLAFESPALSYHAYRRLRKWFLKGRAPVTLVPTFHLVEGLRAQKDPSELKAIERSLAITERAFQKVLSRLKPGQTEKEISWRIKQLIHLHGGDDPAFEPIVASGPQAALPHAESTDREIKKGEPVLFDLGSKWQGYCSDMSRTVFLGKPSERFKEVYRLVREAQLKAQEGICSGMDTRKVDGLARSIIEKGGYGTYFKHSLGHGVGLATHEIPSLNPLKADLLRPGMVVTIEPGIYLPGWGGVRLENMAIIRKNGARLLSQDMTFYNF